ncbi:Transcription factor GTE8 [Sesamum angolense]|uniref:Transcription factor GTE8 n=1 Tax=Sesamum angolense TaxID=2727404 RepID=A0AAE2BPK7_9LAMI|nr:Transcription factor GTE8 [Sesamum angolense]
MMAKKDRFPPGYSSSFAPHYESEGSGSSGRIDSAEDCSALTRKWIDLNSASRDGFAVPIQVIPLSKLSSYERKSLVLRLTSELEQIRILQNKVESQKRRTAIAVTKSSSSDILSCSNAQQKGLQAGNVKKSSVLGSGPGKKARGWNRGITGRFESAHTGVNANAGLLKQCDSLLKKLMSQQYAWVFNTPVDVVKLNIPDYFDVIKNPMDLGTIKSKLASGKYPSPLDFLADVRLTFTNAKTYNPPGTDVHIMADTMSQFFELRWKTIEKKLLGSTSQSLPGKSGILEETEITKPLPPSKKRKLSPTVGEVMQEPTKHKMTDEEKHKLSSELEDLLGDLPDSIVDFLRAQTSNGGNGGEDEIEIDIDDLSDDTLFTLRKLLDDHLQEKQKNHAKSEACEIELPNVSGLSNSSLRVEKGNDPTDEDVDIGGNEAPVTSYPPVQIDKDAGGRAEECNEAGPDSDRGSECSKDSSAVKQVQDDIGQTVDSEKKGDADELVGGHASVSGLDQLEQGSQLRPYSSDSDGQLDGESAQAERQVSPDKLYRAALLKNRFADTILKAREKTLNQDDKADPELLRREREELEMHKRREKARLQAEARAAEDARKRAEAEAAAEAKRRRELEREAAREALLKMEKTVEINENSRFLEDLEMLRAVAPEQLPSSVDETSPDHSPDGFGSFKFGGSNPLEQLGLYMKADDEEEEADPPSIPNAVGDVEEGEID